MKFELIGESAAAGPWHFGASGKSTPAVRRPQRSAIHAPLSRFFAGVRENWSGCNRQLSFSEAD